MLLYICLLSATRCNFSSSTAVVLMYMAGLVSWCTWCWATFTLTGWWRSCSTGRHNPVHGQTCQHHQHNIINTAVPPDGSNAESAPPPQTHSNICNQAYTKVTDFNQDLAALVATCQHQIRSSAAYCLCIRGGQEVCHFGYPKPLQWRYLWFNKMVQSQSNYMKWCPFE